MTYTGSDTFYKSTHYCNTERPIHPKLYCLYINSIYIFKIIYSKSVYRFRYLSIPTNRGTDIMPSRNVGRDASHIDQIQYLVLSTNSLLDVRNLYISVLNIQIYFPLQAIFRENVIDNLIMSSLFRLKRFQQDFKKNFGLNV